MTSGQTEAPEAALVPLFLGKQRCNITFIVDCSENTSAVLGSVKRLLVQTLLAKASLRDSLFNIMAFSGELSCWSHHMLPCAPDTVYMALSWIHSISCSPGRDLLTALSVALSDPACHAVHLLCTDLPDHPEAVLTALPALAAGRPLNMFYLQDAGVRMDSNSQDYLQCLTRTTRGSCYLIPVGLNGELQKVFPLSVAENQSSVPTISSVKCCCPSTSVVIPHNASSLLLRCSLGNCMMSNQTMSAEFFPGCRVLARREMGGLYYMSTVIQQGQGSRGVWVVEFDHPGSTGLGAVSSCRQLVCSLDMVKHIRAHACYLVPGDAVLSPWEPELRRYGPGRVMAATEHRDGFRVDGVTSLRVLMWNGCVSLVPGSLAWPISVSQHDRIVKELCIPTSASSHCCNWLCARSPSCAPPLRCQTSCCSVSNHRLHLFPPSGGRMAEFKRAEQDADVRKSDPEVPSSSSSLSEDEARATFPPVVKLRSKEQRPPWRYWRRTGPELQRKKQGGAFPRKTSKPPRFSFPVPQISASPNHSALFQSLPGDKRRLANIRDVFGASYFKPQPPVGLKSFSGNNASAVYM